MDARTGGGAPLRTMLREDATMTANRKRIGDAAEKKEQRRLEEDGWTVFPLSPSLSGVDLIAVRGNAVALVEVKSGVLYGKAFTVALRKLEDAAARVRAVTDDRVLVMSWIVEGDG